jgi:hypothetical protein
MEIEQFKFIFPNFEKSSISKFEFDSLMFKNHKQSLRHIYYRIYYVIVQFEIFFGFIRTATYGLVGILENEYQKRLQM